jgi:hypothetical protein
VTIEDVTCFIFQRSASSQTLKASCAIPADFEKYPFFLQYRVVNQEN